MQHRLAPPSLLCFVLALAGCQSALPAADGDMQVQQALRQWVEAFNACDSSRAAALYSDDALLWGTVSPSLIATPSGIRQYFERACSASQKPKVVLGEVALAAQGTAAAAAGTYTFTVAAGGQVRSIPARFTFSYRKASQGWLITSHHSSPVPTAPVTSSAPVRSQ